jgi:Organic solute transporter Ostalpha
MSSIVPQADLTKLVLSLLTASWEPSMIKSIIHPSSQISFPDLTVALPSVLLCVELAVISIVHLFAFSWKEYDISESFDPSVHYSGSIFGIRALLSALNPMDIIEAIGRGLRWLFIGLRHRSEDISYQNLSSKGYQHEPVESVELALAPAPPGRSYEYQHGYYEPRQDG